MFFTDVDLVALVVIGVLFAVLDPLSTVSLGRGRGVTLSACFPVSLAAVILLGPWGSALISLASAIYQPARPPRVKRLFNAAELALSGACAGLVYQGLGGERMLSIDDFPLVLLVVVAAAGAYSAVNAGLVAGVLYFAQGVPFGHGLRTTLSTGVVGYLGYGLFGLMMAVLWSTDVGVLAAVLVLLPLLVARWAFSQYAAEREAYERTVRALVQAVETKDHYTRGHSERVSLGSELIARRINMTEDRVELLRFAGLLHDLGKLGVPTRLLQKSGAADVGGVRGHPAAPGARRRDGARDRVPARGVRGDHAPPRAGGRARLPDGPGRRRRSRSSPARSPWRTRSTR